MPEHEHVATGVTGGAGEEAHDPTLDAEPVLPEAVRQRVVALAAAAMTGMPADEVPPAVRRVAQFAPNRRARLGGSVIAIQLATDPAFRQRVAARAVGVRRRSRCGRA